MPTSDSTHTTLGRSFLIPAHNDFLLALGRVHYAFNYLEETVVAILWEGYAAELGASRAKMAGPKGSDLQALADRYREAGGYDEIVAALDEAVAAFSEARVLVRNKVAHGHPFTAGYDEDGTYLPGLAYTPKDGGPGEILASSPEDLLDLAENVERAVGPLSRARALVLGNPFPATED